MVAEGNSEETTKNINMGYAKKKLRPERCSSLKVVLPSTLSLNQSTESKALLFGEIILGVRKIFSTLTKRFFFNLLP